MADDELKLRITPEVDEDALKRAQAEIDGISGKVTLGGKGKGGGVDSALKAELASIRANIDANDLKLRKFVANSLEEETLIRKKQALNQLTAQQANTLLAQESNARENMVAETVAGYQLVEKQLASLDQANQQVINRQKQLFYAQERAQSGFSSMSRSMGALTSNTKDANIAFANFGRIVQDAPFGILGISNNIDPLLVSFAALKASAGSTTLALRSMLGVMMGPLGLIFLLGSVLPSALVVAERAMQRKKRATKEATEEVDEFAEALKRAAGAQVGSALSASLTYTQQVDVLSNALQRQKALMSAQVTDTADLIDQFRKGSQAQVENGRITEEQARRGIAAYEESLGITREQDKAVRDIIQGRLDEAKANLLVEQSIKKLNIPRVEENKLLQEANAETERRLLLERQSMQIMAMRQKTIDDMLRSEGFDAFEASTEAIGATALETYQNLALQRIQFERQFTDSSLLIQQERDAKLAGIAQNRLSLGLQDETAYQQQRQLIIDEYAAQEGELAQTVAENRANQMLIYADAVSAGLGAIFGENKAVQSAQVVIDTIAGANKAFAGLMPNFPLAVAAAASVTAQGISALRKINSSTKKSKTLSGSGSASASVASATQKPFVTDAISPTGANIAGRIGAMNNQPQFNVTATVDRMGLALAVRDGESDISTRQIPFAS
jgi:hypothetical protein